MTYTAFKQLKLLQNHGKTRNLRIKELTPGQLDVVYKGLEKEWFLEDMDTSKKCNAIYL